VKPRPEPENIFKKKKKKKSGHSVRDVPSGTKGDEWEIDDSDYPVHEKYTEEEPVKK